jgi:hypothetical protein
MFRFGVASIRPILKIRQLGIDHPVPAEVRIADLGVVNVDHHVMANPT